MIKAAALDGGGVGSGGLEVIWISGEFKNMSHTDHHDSNNLVMAVHTQLLFAIISLAYRLCKTDTQTHTHTYTARTQARAHTHIHTDTARTLARARAHTHTHTHTHKYTL